MNTLQNLLIILFFIMASGIFSGLETGGYLLNRIRLRFRARQKNRSACHLRRVLADAHLFIFTVLIGQNIAVYLVSRNVTQLYLNTGLSAHSHTVLGFIPWNAETAATLTLMLPLFLFAEIIPKNIFRRHADTLMYRFSGLLLFSWRILWPVTAVLKLIFNLLTGGRGRSEALSGFSLSLQGLREYFTEDSRRVSLSDHQHGMIDHLVAMHRISARDVMQPVSAAIAVPENTTVRQALEQMNRTGTEQIAVYRGSVRRITGFLSLFDLLDADENPEAPIKPRVQKLTRLSADLPLTRAFRRLRHKGEAMAVVTDRASRTIGLLHLRDIARYIVSGS